METDWQTTFKNKKKAVRVYGSDDDLIYDVEYQYDLAGRLKAAGETISLPGYSCQSYSCSYGYDMRSQQSTIAA